MFTRFISLHVIYVAVGQNPGTLNEEPAEAFKGPPAAHLGGVPETHLKRTWKSGLAGRWAVCMVVGWDLCFATGRRSPQKEMRCWRKPGGWIRFSCGGYKSEDVFRLDLFVCWEVLWKGP